MPHSVTTSLHTSHESQGGLDVSLTKRGMEVLGWMMEGKRNKEIAQILGVSPRTVEKHVERVLASLKAENRSTAIVRAMELGVKAKLSSR